MKTIISTTKTAVLGFVLLFSSFLKAQDEAYAYRGGIADGHTMEAVENNTCGTPFHQFAYFGGIGDGSSFELLENSPCTATPFHDFAYFGGNGDGYALEFMRVCPVTPPAPVIGASSDNICLNQTVTFSDTSNTAVIWKWTFPGGTLVAPSTINSKNPVVRYTTAGTYSVTLEATNADGTTTVTETNFITVNATASITATTPGSRCGAGSVTISATPNTGTVKWYNAATGGTLLFTGNSFNTPSISTTTTYYAEAFNGCVSATRTAVTATINTVPTITGTGSTSCTGGTFTLTATPSAGTVSWYDAASGGNLLGTGTVFNTPNITATTSYYAETSTATCTSTRIEVKAVVNNTAAPTGDATQVLCGPKTLADLVVTGTAIKWYDAATGGNLLPPSTPIVYGTTYYASQTANGCESASRLAVTVEACLATSNVGGREAVLYPNPVSDILNVKYPSEIASIEIYSMTGQLISKHHENSSHYRMNVQKLTSGVYLLKVHTKDGKTETYKIIKN